MKRRNCERKEAMHAKHINFAKLQTMKPERGWKKCIVIIKQSRNTPEQKTLGRHKFQANANTR